MSQIALKSFNASFFAKKRSEAQFRDSHAFSLTTRFYNPTN